MYHTPPIEALFGTYTNKTAYIFRTFVSTQPLSKEYLKIVVPQIVAKEVKIIFRKTIIGTGTHPQFTHTLVPWPPISLMH
jgi:hypothetical protein